jgi:hypothetical protein
MTGAEVTAGDDVGEERAVRRRAIGDSILKPHLHRRDLALGRHDPDHDLHRSADRERLGTERRPDTDDAGPGDRRTLSNETTTPPEGNETTPPDETRALQEENERLRDELGKFRAQEMITPEEQRRRWGQELLDRFDRA